VTSPSLTRLDAPHQRALVLMLHGGREASHDAVSRTSGAWGRSAAMQRAITRRAHAAGVGTWLLRYREQGWNNDDAPSPVPDARWALDEVRRTLGELPVVLVGHSMGARAAVHVSDDPLVRGVVALAPWLTPADDVIPLVGKVLVAAHGSRDKITSARATAHFVERAAAASVPATFHDMGPVGHYMLRRVRSWNGLAMRQTLAILDPTGP
jgi:pimeloyl-ACP methyl ester carboxylesterase